MAGASKPRLAAGVEVVVRPAVFAPLLVCLGLAVSACFVNRGLPVFDEGAVLTLASRILRGEIFYRDLDAYYFPGAPYLLAGWLWLFGESVNAARWLAAGVFSCMLLGLYSTAVQLLDRRRAALVGLSLLNFKFLAWPAFTSYFYSDLALCFAFGAIALIVGHERRGVALRLSAAGALTALATASKQSLGIYLALAASLLLAFPPAAGDTRRLSIGKRLPEVGAFALGFSVVAIPLLGYFAAQGLLDSLITSGLLRPFLHYMPTSGVSFGEMLAWWRLGELRGLVGFPYHVNPYWTMLMNEWLPGEALYPLYWLVGEVFSRGLYTSVVVVFALALWRCRHAIRRRKADQSEGSLLMLTVLAFAVVLSAFPRADFLHVISVYPIVLLLLFCLEAAGRAKGSGSPRAITWRVAALVLLFLVVTSALATLRHRQQSYRMQVARADLYIDPANSWVESVLAYVEETLDSQDLLFVYGPDANYYFLTGHYYHPWRFTQIYPGQVGGVRGTPLVATLREHPPKLVIRGLLKWPGIPDVASYAQDLALFVTANYEPYDELFEDHPPVMGTEPRAWAFDMLRPRRQPLWDRPLQFSAPSVAIPTGSPSP